MENVHIDPAPNAGIGAAMLSRDCKRACLMYAIRGAQIYRSRVRKESHELELSTSASTTIVTTRWGPRHAGLISVDSEHFLPHEQGWIDEEGEHHEGAHDFNAVLAEMAGLPFAPSIGEVGRTTQRLNKIESEQQRVRKEQQNAYQAARQYRGRSQR